MNQFGRFILYLFLPFYGASAAQNQTNAPEEFLPSHILQMDPLFTHHVILVEKNSHQLFIYKNENSRPKLVKTYRTVTGKFTGNKQIEGDRKTPEGVYFFTDFYSQKDLHERYGDYSKIYGIGAFDMNYPNIMDLRQRKTGTNIWLHATDDNSRIEKGLDSKGCVVVTDENLKDISQYINLSHSAIIVTQNIRYYSKKNFHKNRKKILKTVEQWAKAWEDQDFQSYISYYDPQKYQDPMKGSFQRFRAYKKRVFRNSQDLAIKMSNISILGEDDYVVVRMKQDYKSNLVDDTGKKTLYLQQDENYDWKIVAELFEKLPDPDNIAFNKSMRYFSE